MPELELGDLTSPTGRAVTIFRVAAVMAWPEPQEPEEREARERCFAEIAASVRRHRETGQALSEIWNHTDRKEYIATRALTWLLAGWSRERGGSLKEDYKRSGGEARVAEAPRWSKQVADCDEYEVRWTVTAAMMMELRKLDAADAAGAIPGVAEPVSVNKAAYLVTKLLPTFDNEHHIEEIWRRYRPVAHLCAALMTWGGESYEELDRNFQRHLFDHTAFLIAGAKLYEDWLVGRFGEESKKDGEGKKEMRIRREDLWWIPISDVEGAKLLPAPKLSPDEIDWLENYEPYEKRRVKSWLDLIRTILRKVDSDPKFDGSSRPVTPASFGITGHSDEEVLRYLIMMVKHGFLEGDVKDAEQLRCLIISKLTRRGREFLDAVRDAEIWRKTKERARSLDEVDLNLLWEIAQAEAKARLGLK